MGTLAERQTNDETKSKDRSKVLKSREKLKAERELFLEEVEAKGERSRKARAEGDRTLRAGLGAFGMVGWSIAVPMLLGMVLGLWIDGRTGGGVRYTLSLLVLGLIVGAVNVWNWMNSK